MSDSQRTPWADYLAAPKTQYHLYIQEKIYFAGIFIGPILYGILVMLFSRCVATLFNPIHRRERGVKWGLVSYAVVMFSTATILTGIGFNDQSNSYIDNREFPGVGDALPPGPLGYQSFTFSDTLPVVASFIFFLNGWLADGLLLYRCYVIYSMNLWVIAFPCLMYLGSLATGVLFLAARLNDASYGSTVYKFGLPYILISISLNILLTFMIVTRLVLQIKGIRTAMGITGINGLCKAIITVLIESCALYTVSSLLVIGPWAAGYHDVILFLPILCQTQVIAPLLIIQRVASRSALTCNTLVSGHLSSFDTSGGWGGPTVGSYTLPAVAPPSSVNGCRMNSGELEVGVETTIDFHRGTGEI